MLEETVGIVAELTLFVLAGGCEGKEVRRGRGGDAARETVELAWCGAAQRRDVVLNTLSTGCVARQLERGTRWNSGLDLLISVDGRAPQHIGERRRSFSFITRCFAKPDSAEVGLSTPVQVRMVFHWMLRGRA